MYFLKLVYNEVFYRPLLNGLLFLTYILPLNDLGFAVILLTLIIKTITFPFTHKMVKTQSALKKLEPEINKIYKDNKNKEEQTKALMELYRAHGINPLSGFLSLLIQIPLLIALYRVFYVGLPFKQAEIYTFLTIPAHINTLFLGFIELTLPNIGIAALAATSQFWQAKLASPPTSGGAPSTKDFGKAMQMQMRYIFPVLIFFIGMKMPAAVSLYWTAMNVFAIIHEAFVRKRALLNGQKQTTS